MEILAYGEDALTLWALKNKLAEILNALDDNSDPGSCLVFFRPSFGRGGRGMANFGEFDFILLADETVYLGESKWDRLTGKVAASTFDLADVQTRRHRLIRFYIEEWAFGDYSDWDEFVELGQLKLEQLETDKQIAPADSGLRDNLEQVLGAIQEKYIDLPTIRDVFLFLHRGVPAESIPKVASGDFHVVAIDCSEDLDGKYIRLNP